MRHSPDYYKRYIGERVSKWTILDVVKHKGLNKFKAKCDCGNVRFIVPNVLLRSKAGCRKCFTKNATARGNPSEYATWQRIRSSGKRNDILVCKRWENFDSFMEDMGQKKKGQVLVRKSKKKGYSPSNCCWGEREDVVHTGKRVTYRGKTLTMAQWARELGLTRQALDIRFQRYESLDEILSPRKKVGRGQGNAGLYTDGKESMTAVEWAKKLRVNTSTIYRMSRGGELWKEAKT